MNRFLVLFVAIFTFATAAEPVKDFYDNAYYDMASESPLNFQLLTQIIEDYDFRSVEETLDYLKIYFPEFFDNYILMYHSRSLQTSSFENPRAILFDRSGHFVFTFNGKSGQRGFNNLEIMQFDPETKFFEFREISFSTSGDYPPRFSEANPAKCMACHQSHFRKENDPRPNWEPYNVWPGSFGSMNGDFPTSDYRYVKAREQGLDEHMIAKAKQEKTKLDHFLENIQPNHPRYKFLSEDFNAKLNTEFTEIIAAANAQRLGRQLAAIDPLLMDYLKYPLLGLFQCRQLMVNEEQQEWLKARLELLGRDTSIKFHGSTYNKRFDKSFRSLKISDGLIYLLEPFGVSTQDWSMDFQTDGRLAFSERFGVPAYPNKTMNLGYRDGLGYWEGEKMSCLEIGEKAWEAMNRLFQSSDLEYLLQKADKEFENQNAPLINRCIKCHESNDFSIPQIPFSDELLLRDALKQRAIFSPRTVMDEIRHRTGPYVEAHERMPMGSVPTMQQTEDLIDYLESL